MNLIASVEGRGAARDLATIVRRLERMCGATDPSSEWGIVFHRPSMSPEREFTVAVEIAAASDLDEAQAAFDAFREKVLPGEGFGLTFWNLREEASPSPAM